MFRNAYQCGLLSIFYSCGSKPLELWDVEVKNGHIKRLTDKEVRSIVLEIGGANVSTTFITCPKGGKALGITLPYMVMIVKSLGKQFTFEVTVLDKTGARRRFRISNFQNTTQILPLCTTMPITLNDGWNQIQFNLAEFTKRSYKTEFMEVSKLKINANIRLRRVYFTEVLLPEDLLPPEYKLYIPLTNTKALKAKVKVDELKQKEKVKTTKQRGVKKGSKADIGKDSSKTNKDSSQEPPKTSTAEITPMGEKPEVEDANKSESTTATATATATDSVGGASVPPESVADGEPIVPQGEKPIPEEGATAEPAASEAPSDGPVAAAPTAE